MVAGLFIAMLIFVPIGLIGHTKTWPRPENEPREWVSRAGSLMSCLAHHKGIQDWDAFQNGKPVVFKMWQHRSGKECPSNIEIQKFRVE